MNWITTNIRFPEDQYMELKMEAARTRKSFAALVRERVTTPKPLNKKATKTKSDKSVAKFMREIRKLAKETAKQNKGINFSKALIEMRYEQ